MKFIASLAALASVALAQNAGIGYPKEAQKLHAGDDVVVQVQRPNSLTGSTELSVAIGITSCVSSPCLSPEDTMGNILYHGDFKPSYHESSAPPYENFTVKVPSSLKNGKAQINVAHFALVGASNYPFLETLNRTVTIA
ncbi:hypothetical protein N7532_008889 [Penicillium argentinense]|uniref:Uncharacterized protein n=1 Tax=Penicillium argentinense TaxID=1131581 RepID=A0A9W9EYH8_9EURO|nr:uncharacterized protein N7532_008889 [Penicillium argentinense]KAJ5090205.1 hypothetical protein N7532_008889 [Penicillium argentinense]